MQKKKKRIETVPCPYCGVDIRSDAKACPHCGSDDRTGWSEGRYLDGIDLPDDTEYDEVLQKEFSSDRAHPRISKVAVVGGILLILFIAGILRAVL
ncbi:MAG: zinc ribbon domain-containing protein [Chitinivibrionales bacterium]|nr:zinc ribbon domain-containing protein [Chitinivibrionales bacterium]MBD3358632.1 zinc ribbon domain-containing protein [Chitinivibrionales bacterium]